MLHCTNHRESLYMRPKSPRLAVRAIILDAGKLLMVNAYPDGQSDLLCAPGGGVEIGSSLPENLAREVFEETGLSVVVGDPCLVNEFHDPNGSFHQVDIYFHCQVQGSAQIDPKWQDTDEIVSQWHWLSADELAAHPHKPDSLAAVAFGAEKSVRYDPLEPILR